MMLAGAVPEARQLSLCSRVVFVDWHGVLSLDPFWTSIRRNPRHPLMPVLESRVAEVLAGESSFRWMRGGLSSDDVVAGMGLCLDRRFGRDFLRRRLADDCAGMSVNLDLLKRLSAVRTDAALVLATDNMDCFADAFARARASRRRPAPDRPPTLHRWAAVFDDLLCSSDLGRLKAEDPVGFFGPWLAGRGLRFGDAILVDDRADNCAAFERAGGRALRWAIGDNADAVQSSLALWLAGPPAQATRPDAA